ncbi:MAG: hypothetical protein EU531_01155 [Promethearchaeota archaeon]|nr:MAG: hypothetical protein EU531_01155 [Candidatus Lokiarchaeota archaeon]
MPKKNRAYPEGFLKEQSVSKKLDFNANKDVISCENCGYKIIRPYPKDQLCPRCGKFLANLYSHKDMSENEESKQKIIKEFDTRTAMPSKKFGSKVRVKQKVGDDFSLSDDFIPLQQNNEYLRFLGITTKKGRNKLFYSNNQFKYLLELANNLDYIAVSILGGKLDKMLLISKDNIEEKCQFLVLENLIYVVFGNFPDKKGKWILEQMAKYYSDLIQNRDVDALTETERYDIERKFLGPANFLINEYKRLQKIFTDKEIPYLEDWMRIDYLGLSSMSIGVISLLLDTDGNLNVEVPGEYENEYEEIEMKESLLTAKIEAIAANTLGNTGSYPRWIAVKLGFQHYRFLTFKKYQNDYFLSLLSEGNLRKLDKIESKVEPYLYHGIDKPFSGNLRPFNKLKATIKDMLNKFPEHKIS